MSAADNSRNVRASFDLSARPPRLLFTTTVVETLFLAPPRAPPPTWPTFRIDARHSVTSVEKVERGIRPGRCADVTLGWRAETGRQVVVGHTRTTHIHTYVHGHIHMRRRVGRLLLLPFTGTSRFRFLSFSLSLPFPPFADARTRGDSHGGIERAQPPCGKGRAVSRIEISRG